MRAAADKSSLISIDKLAIIAALRICEELFSSKEEHGEREKILDGKLKEMAETIQSAIR
jgi:cell division protein ZapA (FtsZ GTPase activity inhibitor)